MPEPSSPPLKPPHSAESLVPSKLEMLSRVSTEALVASLAPGQPGALKVRPDRTMLDGHHRVHLLRLRGLDVDGLPREIVAKAEAS